MKVGCESNWHVGAGPVYVSGKVGKCLGPMKIRGPTKVIKGPTKVSEDPFLGPLPFFNKNGLQNI